VKAKARQLGVGLSLHIIEVAGAIVWSYGVVVRRDGFAKPSGAFRREDRQMLALEVLHRRYHGPGVVVVPSPDLLVSFRWVVIETWVVLAVRARPVDPPASRSSCVVCRDPV
jgi:hypothetical protein